MVVWAPMPTVCYAGLLTLVSSPRLRPPVEPNSSVSCRSACIVMLQWVRGLDIVSWSSVVMLQSGAAVGDGMDAFRGRETKAAASSGRGQPRVNKHQSSRCNAECWRRLPPTPPSPQTGQISDSIEDGVEDGRSQRRRLLVSPKRYSSHATSGDWADDGRSR